MSRLQIATDSGRPATTRFTCSSGCPDSPESHRGSAHTVPGREARLVESPAGKLGLAVCYDMRFPELFRVLSRQGAELFVVPSAFTVPTGQGALGSVPARTGHRKSVLADRAGAVGTCIRAGARPMAIR